MIKNTNEQIEDVMRLLKEKGILMSISSCGCCDGISLHVQHDGKVIADTSYAQFDMFKDNK